MKGTICSVLLPSIKERGFNLFGVSLGREVAEFNSLNSLACLSFLSVSAPYCDEHKRCSRAGYCAIVSNEKLVQLPSFHCSLYCRVGYGTTENASCNMINIYILCFNKNVNRLAYIVK